MVDVENGVMGVDERGASGTHCARTRTQKPLHVWHQEDSRCCWTDAVYVPLGMATRWILGVQL